MFWGLTRNWDLALLMSLINYAVSYWLQRQVSESAGAVEKAAPDLKLLAEVLEIIEREPFLAERLTGLRARLDTHHVPASRAVAKLERIYDWLEDRRNGFVAIFNAFVFYTAQLTIRTMCCRKFARIRLASMRKIWRILCCRRPGQWGMICVWELHRS